MNKEELLQLINKGHITHCGMVGKEADLEKEDVLKPEYVTQTGILPGLLSESGDTETTETTEEAPAAETPIAEEATVVEEATAETPIAEEATVAEIPTPQADDVVVDPVEPAVSTDPVEPAVSTDPVEPAVSTDPVAAEEEVPAAEAAPVKKSRSKKTTEK